MNDLTAQVLTVKEAAALMRVSPRSYYAAVARGEMPGLRIGRRIVVPGAALARVMGEGGEAMPLRPIRSGERDRNNERRVG